jgi:hypothetical protein
VARGVDITWQGGEHTFLLTIDLLRALQERCDAGPAFILSRLTSGEWLVDDITSTIRLALEGGGLEKEDARRLVKRHIEEDFGVKHVLLARAILTHTLFSEEGGDDAGEPTSAAAA